MPKIKEIIPEFSEKAMPISPLSSSFTNEDMNKVVEKVNEIIAHLNNVL